MGGAERIQVKVLVIDDREEMGWIIKRALAFSKTSVEWVSSGQQGIVRARQDPFDLILLDVEMPGMDGFETCRHLKEDKALKSMPIVFLSGRTDPETQMKGLDLGAEYFLSKPIELAELWSIVSFLTVRDNAVAARNSLLRRIP